MRSDPNDVISRTSSNPSSQIAQQAGERSWHTSEITCQKVFETGAQLGKYPGLHSAKISRLRRLRRLREVQKVEERLSALGNCIACNDYVPGLMGLGGRTVVVATALHWFRA